MNAGNITVELENRSQDRLPIRKFFTLLFLTMNTITIFLETEIVEQKSKPKPWVKAEIRRLKRLYPMSHNKDLARLFGRTTQSILAKAKKLGLKKDWEGGYRVPQPPQNENLWTKNDVRQLRKMYLTSSNSEIAVKIKRTCSAVQAKIRKLGLYQEFKKQGLTRKVTNNSGINLWTNHEIDILKKRYPENTCAKVAKELGRTSKAVRIKARRLGLSANQSKNLWTAEDDAFIKKYYSKWPIEKIAKKLGRTPLRVQRRAWKKHLTGSTRTKQRFWTKQEIRKLEYFLSLRYSREEIATKLGRSIESVGGKIKRLGLKKSLIWTNRNIAILKKYFPIESNVSVAKRLGVEAATVRYKAIELGLRKSIYINSKQKRLAL